jgi:SAM-dependent methyltransferase
MTKQKNHKEIFDKFAIYYDQIYHDKSYIKEVNFILKNLKKYGGKNIQNILDIGCGTGTHSVLLAKKGFSITGIDRSKQALDIARVKFDANNQKGKFLIKDFKNFNLNPKSDACVSLFCSMCYLENLDDLEKSLKSIRNSLKKGGLFIFDIWNGNAVVSQGPSIKEKRIKNKDLEIIRIARPEMDYSRQICKISYDCTIVKNKKVIDNFVETHPIRYHFLDDLVWIMEKNGFKVLKTTGLSSTPKGESYLTEWYLYVIAKKV